MKTVVKKAGSKLSQWFQEKSFNLIHTHNLVYNACWEDPRLDRVALKLGPNDTIMMITSAGCNALDYVLQEPRHIYAVDMNPRQNALLELKIAGIRNLDHDDFFALFGAGRAAHCRDLYRHCLRADLSQPARVYWDRHISIFSGKRRRPSFYFHGTSGILAWMLNVYIDRVAKVRDGIDALLSAQSVEEQHEIYQRELRSAFWTKFLRWCIDRNATMFLAGVPRAQRIQVEKHYPGGLLAFIQDQVETVFTRLPLHDNYFWRVYLDGSYSADCCPEYLKHDNFEKLKTLVDRVSTHTCSILNFLTEFDGQLSRFVLLDHMDWLSAHRLPILEQQWQMLINRSAPGARYLWRSGAMRVDFVDPIPVTVNGKRQKVGDVLTYQTELATELHKRDRVHTYGSFYIADLNAN